MIAVIYFSRKRVITMSTQGAKLFQTIPNELLCNILSHLPLKKQAAIKHVARLWCYLVNFLEQDQLKVIENTLKEEFPFLEIPQNATIFEKSDLLENQQQIYVDLAKEWGGAS